MAAVPVKMSLVAQFDDLNRYTALLLDSENNYIKFVRLVQQWRKNWLSVDVAFRDLRTEHAATLLELNEWRVRCESTKKKLREEQLKRIRIEGKLLDLQNIFGEVKEVVNRDVTITNQTKERFMQYTKCEPLPLEQEDQSVLYDKTEDDLDLQDDNSIEPKLGKRTSPRKSATPPKSTKSSSDLVQDGRLNTQVITNTNCVAPKGDITATSEVCSIQRCNSEPEAVLNSPSNVLSNVNSNRLTSAMSLSDGTPKRNSPRIIKNSINIRPHLSGSKLSTRLHNFVSKTVIRPENCLPCGRRIKFYKEAMKCIDCRSACHPECQNMVPLPCVPCSQTPKANRGERSTVGDFAPNVAPMVPALLIYCINEIEKRCMIEVGLYRVPGSEREVRELREIFLKSKGMPNLSKVDVNVLCGVIKDFLRSIETLIPRTLWQDFIKAAEIEDSQDSLTALYQCISQLPQANRDTLAYLILHLQRISETPEIKMSVNNIATVLGPTIVGYSSANLQPEQLLSEQRRQCRVMENLLLISSDYWSTFISVDNESLYSRSSRTTTTPDSRTPEQSLLGPLRSNSFRSVTRNVVTKTPKTGRITLENTQQFKRKFFATPHFN